MALITLMALATILRSKRELIEKFISDYGGAVWFGVSDAAEYAVQAAKDAVAAAAFATSSAASETGRSAAATYSIVESRFRKLLRRLKSRFYR